MRDSGAKEAEVDGGRVEGSSNERLSSIELRRKRSLTEEEV